MGLHTHWRDTKAWKDEGLALSTTSDEAAKLFDASLTQYVGWRDEPSVGGIEKSLSGMVSADPNFVLAHVLTNGLELMGTGRSVVLDPTLKSSLDDMNALASKSTMNDRETKHLAAVQEMAKGYWPKAASIWEDILIDYPTDMLAAKFAWDSYFYLGYQAQMRDCIARVFPHWKPDSPLYGYLHGMHAFGLVETYNYAAAERESKKGLELNAQDCCSTHSLAHVYEMNGRQNEGIALMSGTVKDWSTCGMLACHNFWHWALYHVEKGEYQGALDLYDSEVGERVKGGVMIDITDACSLLYRLEMEGVDVGDRWEDLYEISRPHIDDHLMVFNDIHVIMACLGAKQKETTQKMMESMETFIREGEGTTHGVTKAIGYDLCRAFVAYDEGDYGKATDLFAPLRYKLVSIGGSNAQRDIFNLFLIQAAMKSPNPHHKKLARHLLTERKALKECAPLTDRLVAKAMAQHHD